MRVSVLPYVRRVQSVTAATRATTTKHASKGALTAHHPSITSGPTLEPCTLPTSSALPASPAYYAHSRHSTVSAIATPASIRTTVTAIATPASICTTVTAILASAGGSTAPVGRGPIWSWYWAHDCCAHISAHSRHDHCTAAPAVRVIGWCKAVSAAWCPYWALQEVLPRASS